MRTLTRFALAIIGILVATVAQAQDVQVDGTTVRVTLTQDALQARNPVPTTVTTVAFRAGAVRDIWCVVRGNPAPDFKDLLTSRVAGQPASALNALKSSVNGTTDRKQKLDSLFKSGPRDHHIVLLTQIGPTSQPLTGAQKNTLLTGQPVSIPIEPFVGLSNCYSTTYIDSVIAEAMRILDVVVAELGR